MINPFPTCIDKQFIFEKEEKSMALKENIEDSLHGLSEKLSDIENQVSETDEKLGNLIISVAGIERALFEVDLGVIDDLVWEVQNLVRIIKAK